MTGHMVLDCVVLDYVQWLWPPPDGVKPAVVLWYGVRCTVWVWRLKLACASCNEHAAQSYIWRAAAPRGKEFQERPKSLQRILLRQKLDNNGPQYQVLP